MLIGEYYLGTRGLSWKVVSQVQRCVVRLNDFKIVVIKYSVDAVILTDCRVCAHSAPA
jgi:hypothetical protein